jgi:hypothetical protein
MDPMNNWDGTDIHLTYSFYSFETTLSPSTSNEILCSRTICMHIMVFISILRRIYYMSYLLTAIPSSAFTLEASDTSLFTYPLRYLSRLLYMRYSSKSRWSSFKR